jgi:hypothetical protein
MSGATNGGTYNEIDVTGYVTANGEYSFALTPLTNTNLRLATRETTNPPQLVITQDVSGNTPPTAGDVVLTTDEDTPGVWTPVVSDPDPDTLSCTIVSQPSNGSATVNADCSSGTYTPDPESNGSDSFVYDVSDGSLSNTATVSVTVTPLNDDPTVDAQAVSVAQDVAVTIVLTASDIDGDCPLGFAVGTAPLNGSLGPITNDQCTAGVASAEILYTPDAGYSGPDSFTFTAIDPTGAVSIPATVTLTVDPPQTNFTFNAVADTWVDANSVDRNYGTSRAMRVDGSPDRRSYLRFDVAGITGAVLSATLRVYANSNHSTGYSVRDVADNTWNESSVTYTNAPSHGGVLGMSGATNGGTYNEIDVTGYVTANGEYSFALTPLNNTNLRLATRETTTPPQLIIIVGSP